MTNQQTDTGKPDDTGLGFHPPGFAVDVRQIDQKMWALLADLQYTGAREHFTVPRDAETDFASVPRIFVWFIPTYGKYTKAAILHDELCRRAEAGQFSRREADGVFRQAMRLQEVAFLRRWVMWTGVRWGAVKSHESRKGWWKDGWLVLPISFLLLFVILLPAVSIILALLLWYVVELVAWLFLEMACRIKTARGEPSKKVNRPRLSLRL
jgi:Protein of unknown function (DUF1353)